MGNDLLCPVDSAFAHVYEKLIKGYPVPGVRQRRPWLAPPRARSGMVPSAAGWAFTTLPPIVATLRIWGAPIYEAPMPSARPCLLIISDRVSSVMVTATPTRTQRPSSLSLYSLHLGDRAYIEKGYALSFILFAKLDDEVRPPGDEARFPLKTPHVFEGLVSASHNPVCLPMHFMPLLRLPVSW